ALSDGAEKLALGARGTAEGKADPVELGGQLLALRRLRLRDLGALFLGFFPSLQGRGGRRQRQPRGKKIVAAEAVGDVLDVPGTAQFVDVGAQDDLHGSLWYFIL